MSWIKQIFSESGEGSFSRLGAFVALAFSCAWISFIVWRMNVLPPLDGITLFIATLYGLGKAGETIQRISK